MEDAKVIKGENNCKLLSSGDIIPTGFTELDQVLGGGLGVGTFACIHGTSGQDLSAFAAYVAMRMSTRCEVSVVSLRLCAEGFFDLMYGSLQEGSDRPSCMPSIAEPVPRDTVAEHRRRNDGKMAGLDVVDIVEAAGSCSDVVVVDGAWESCYWKCPYYEFDNDGELEELFEELCRSVGLTVVATRREWWMPFRDLRSPSRKFGYDFYLDRSMDEVEADVVGRPELATATLLAVDRDEKLWHPPVSVGFIDGNFRDCFDCVDADDWRSLPVDHFGIVEGRWRWMV